MAEISILNGYKIKDKKAVRYYDTISNMKSDTTLKAGMYVKTKGYYSVNDGGNAEYYIRTKTNEDVEDNGSIHFIGDLVAELIVSERVSIKQFGAYGNNVNDDTTKIQNAITYCESNNLSLYIPKGDYYLSSTLEIEGTSIKGDSSKNTVFHLNNCDGLLLKQYNSSKICVIEDITFVSDELDTEIAGITFQKYNTSDKTHSYKINNLYFYNLGCAILIQDAFRCTLSNIGANKCFKVLFIKEQTVQCSFINIIANSDLDVGITSTRFGDSKNSNKTMGIQVGVRGESNPPEGIKLNQVCCTGYNVGIYVYDCLYFNATQCEFDLCEEQAVIMNAGSGIIFEGCWLANKPTSTLPIVDMLVSDQSNKTRGKRLINCTIYNSSTQNNVVGVYIGRGVQFGYNFGVIGCTIYNSPGCQLKQGIYFDRCRESIIANNNIHGCETDILFITNKSNQLINNITETLDITIHENTKLYAWGNIYTNKTLVEGGTLVGNFD